MNGSWKIDVLRSKLQAAGDSRALDFLSSIDRYVRIFLYHLATARDAMVGLIDKDKPGSMDNVSLILGASPNSGQFRLAAIVSEANLLGAIHSARALYDVFSNLVNALILNRLISEDRCDIRTVALRLPHGTLKLTIDELLLSRWFQYVAAFVNTAKHRCLVPHSFSVSLEEGVAGFRIRGFEYKGELFPEYSITEVLEGVLDVKNRVVACGCALNDAVLGEVVAQ